MGVIFKPTILTEKELAEVSSLIFVQMAQDGTLDDITISEHPSLFPTWSDKWTGKAGTILMNEGRLYRAVEDVSDIEHNERPSPNSTKWTAISPRDDYPSWSAPIGTNDAYSKGAKSSCDGKKWVSTVEGNIFEPGVHGWEEVK